VTKGEDTHRLPHLLPSGKGVLFTVMREDWDQQPRVAVLHGQSRQWRNLLEDAADARYVPTGHIVFLRRGTLMAAQFDLNRLEITGQPAPIISDIMQALNIPHSFHNSAAGQFSISASGTLVYAVGGTSPDPERSLVWVDQKGAAQPALPFSGFFGIPRLSPDGRRIAYGLAGHEWAYDLVRGIATRLTSDGRAGFVTWAPDGKRIAFDRSIPGSPNIYWQAVEASSPMERLTTSEWNQFAGSWSPDGTTLAFVQCGPDPGCHILLMDVKRRRVTSFLPTEPDSKFPEFSPDGRWLAWATDQSGHFEVYLSRYPGPGGKWLISQEGGKEPLWDRTGKQLFYRRGDEVWAVDVQTGPSLSIGKPHLLFEHPGLVFSYPIRAWDLSLDGRRFLMLKNDERKPTPVTELLLVQNWFEELKRLAPGGKK
jgi:serine/threonine-protein kinase